MQGSVDPRVRAPLSRGVSGRASPVVAPDTSHGARDAARSVIGRTLAACDVAAERPAQRLVASSCGRYTRSAREPPA